MHCQKLVLQSKNRILSDLSQGGADVIIYEEKTQLFTWEKTWFCGI